MGIKLVLCEKPSVGQSVAKVLSASVCKDGYLEGSGWLVSWCFGHLVEPAPADNYDARYSRWAKEDLPILPNPWKYLVPAGAQRQFGIIKSLMERPDVEEIIEATDAGREGELIFRLVYHQAGCRKPFSRLWISSLEDKAVREGFQNLRPGSCYDSLYESALCRAKADWLVGINATRLFSVLYGGKTLNVGRVMTPTLALLAGREEEIEGFKKEKFYTMELSFDGFSAASGRIGCRTQAQKIRQSCIGKMALVTSYKRREKEEKPPRLYDLTTLQREANRIYGYTARQTLDYLQALYEKKLATYPRTDSRYLTEDVEGMLPSLCVRVSGAFPFAAGLSARIDAGRVIDNKKVSDHHAILPTERIGTADMGAMPTGERNILALLAGRLLCAVCVENYVSVETVAELECQGSLFTARGNMELAKGWKAIEGAFRDARGKKQEEEKAEAEKMPGPLPELYEGQPVMTEEAALREGVTRAPSRYTEDSLLHAMENAGAGDFSAETERKGLGTPATRAGIIEKIVKGGFATRKGRQLTPTKEGRELIRALPDVVKSPKLTADWENALAQVEKGALPTGEFMAGIESMVSGLVQGCPEPEAGMKKIFEREKAVLGKCPNCGGQVAGGKYGAYCRNKCGMNVGRVMGTVLPDAQVEDLLSGKKILVKGLKGREGRVYDAFLIPKGTENYKYVKDGEEKNGVRFQFAMEFPDKKHPGGR